MFGFFRKNKKISMKRKNFNINEKIITNKINNVRNMLSEGDEGENVEMLQNMLRSIIHICPSIPVVNMDGKYNSQTKNAVEVFQKMMGIDKTGVVDNSTWERLKLIYAKKDEIKAVEKIEFNNIEK